MPEPTASLTSWGALAWVGVVAIASFALAWLLADRFHARKSAYDLVLFAVAGGLLVGYLTWSGRGIGDVWSHRWGWGLVGALLSGGILSVQVARRWPRTHPLSGSRLTRAVGIEGLLYGATEGVLLSVLPVLAAWDGFRALGWTEGAVGIGASGVLALAASVAVIWVHHLGYPQFRGRQVVPVLLGVGILSLAYLLTGSPIAPVGGHVALHVAALLHGTELPPYEGAPALPQPGLRPAAITGG